MSLALPPVGWQSIIEHEPHSTVVCAWLKTVVMLKQPGHFTSMKKELGDCTNRLSLCFRFSSLAEGWRRSRTILVVARLLLGTCVGDGGLLAARAGGAVPLYRDLGGARRATVAAGRGARSAAFCAYAVASARRGARPRGPRVAARRLFLSC